MSEKLDYAKLRRELNKLMKEAWAQRIIEIVKSCEVKS